MREKLPLRIVFAAIISTNLALGLVGWHAAATWKALSHLQERNTEAMRLYGEILLLDEQLTTATLLAAATGNSKWERHYLRIEPVLDSALAQLKKTFPELEVLASMKQTEDANTELVKFEKQSFSLVQKNRRTEADQILASPQYEKQKALYTLGMSRLRTSILQLVELNQSNGRNRVRTIQYVFLLFVILSVLGWIYLFFITQRWAKARQKLIEDLDHEIQSKTALLLNTSKMTALGEMAGGVAHEINNPLAIIKSLSGQLIEVMDDKPLDLELIKNMASKIEATTNRIALIVQGLQKFSRDGSNDATQPIAVSQLLRETLSYCSEAFKNSQTSLIVETFDERIIIDGRVTELSQVLLNLLNNARDAVCALDEKWVKISVKDSPEQIELRVTDSGAKISVDVQKKMFQPFFTTKEVGKGTGLGLSISIGIIQSHGGELNLDSKSANTCFVIRLPKKERWHDQRA